MSESGTHALSNIKSAMAVERNRGQPSAQLVRQLMRPDKPKSPNYSVRKTIWWNGSTNALQKILNAANMSKHRVLVAFSLGEAVWTWML